MKFKILCMGSCQYFVFSIILILCTYYNISIGREVPQSFENFKKGLDVVSKKYDNTVEKCNNLNIRVTNITTSDVFAKFDFKPKWIETTKYWDQTFQNRFEKHSQDPHRYPSKIIIVPHSHNDPGWLRTYLDYFDVRSRNILNSIISQMIQHTDLTFIWSEISFLQLWWDQATVTERKALKNLIDSGRFEITTGGWVMTDEANVHIYAMIDQLIEGHQWIKSNLNTKPTIGWSIDPFGHGATMPYLLAASGFHGMVIQRIHYAWKQWFAKHQRGDFIWQPAWKTLKDINRNILTHNMPFDIYSIQNSCGPDRDVCRRFDFRFQTDDIVNIEKEAKLLIEQYSKTASLYSHNVALIPLGEDFAYSSDYEIDLQYTNYKKLIDYINYHKEYFNMEVSFGTPKDYFSEIKKRTNKYSTLKGDFFVYSDIFSNGRPSYWSGYYSTRPFYKILSNELESNLRSTEILFTLAFNMARQHKHTLSINMLKNSYHKIILARRNLGLFQHHDAITGTSKEFVMEDYGLRLFNSIQDSVILQQLTIEMLLQNNSFNKNFLISDFERNDFNKLPVKRLISIKDSNVKLFVIFNSLAQKRTEILTMRTDTPDVLILNENGFPVEQQINPVWNIIHYGVTTNISMSTQEYEIIFLAELPPISLLTFRLVPTKNYKNNLARVYSNDYFINNTKFEIKQLDNITLQNNKIKLFFDKKSGFLKSLIRKNTGLPMKCEIMFAAYKSIIYESGAYLFKTYSKQKYAESNILEYENRIFITSGPLSSDVTVVYGPFLAHTVRIFNTGTHLDNAIYIENDIDFVVSIRNVNKELFMRFVTEIKNGLNPEFYSDQNGFQFQHRVKVPTVGIEGNYFPITTTAFIQDTTKRITLLTTHAQGAASLRSGELEVMLDRYILVDDKRGMGEGITDSILTRHKFWLIVEDIDLKITSNYQVPSLYANNLGNSLRFPPNLYFIENGNGKITKNFKTKVNFLKHEFPCDLHLLNVRTLTERHRSKFPSRSALLLLHRQGYDCNIGEEIKFCNNTMITILDLFFNGLALESIESTSLTAFNKIGPITNFQKLSIEPMDIKTFQLNFELEV